MMVAEGSRDGGTRDLRVQEGEGGAWARLKDLRQLPEATWAGTAGASWDHKKHK